VCKRGKEREEEREGEREGEKESVCVRSKVGEALSKKLHFKGKID